MINRVKIDKFFEKLSLKKKNNIYYDNIYYDDSNYIRTTSDEHGFQLNFSDIGNFIKSRLGNFFKKEQIDGMIEYINNFGYLDPNIGEYLKQCIDNENYDTYIKTVHSNDVDSIFNEGIRCLGTTTSVGGGKPTTINSISFENTITKVDEIIFMCRDIKNAFGY